MKWILADRQGSVAVVTDNSGKATQRFAYDPFGNETAGAPGTGFPFRYTGQRFDPETGLWLAAAGKPKVVVTTAIAREMAGFIWAIAQIAQPAVVTH